MPQPLPPLVSVAPLERWVPEVLGRLVQVPIEQLEAKTGITGLQRAFDTFVANPAGQAAQRALTRGMRRVR